MSYDILLKRKSDSKPLISKEEFTSSVTKTDYPVCLHDVDDMSKVWNFALGTSKKDYLIYAFKPEFNAYYTYCSYAVTVEEFMSIRDIIIKVAKLFDMSVSDPQTGKNDLEPDDYAKDAELSAKIFIETKGKSAIVVKEVSEIIDKFSVKSESDYFIILDITNKDPDTNDVLILKLASGGLYASKVKKGQSLIDVVEDELVQLFGRRINFFINKQAFYDSAKDKKGNVLKRYIVDVTVPYFNPSNSQSKFNFVWEKLEPTNKG